MVIYLAFSKLKLVTVANDLKKIYSNFDHDALYFHAAEFYPVFAYYVCKMALVKNNVTQVRLNCH